MEVYLLLQQEPVVVVVQAVQEIMAGIIQIMLQVQVLMEVQEKQFQFQGSGR